MHSVLNTLSEYTYFYISENITSYTFLLDFKISVKRSEPGALALIQIRPKK